MAAATPNTAQATVDADSAETSTGRVVVQKGPESVVPFEDPAVRINQAAEDTMAQVKGFTASVLEATTSSQRLLVDTYAETAQGVFAMQRQLVGPGVRPRDAFNGAEPRSV